MTTFASPEVTQDPGTQAINDLVDEQFARLAPQLGRYVADPRRRYEHQPGAALTLGDSERGRSVQDDDATRGFVHVWPAQREGRSSAITELVNGVANSLGASGSLSALREALATGMLPPAKPAYFKMTLCREEHPKNWNAYAMGDPGVYGEGTGYDLSILGLRRKAAAVLTFALNDPETERQVSTLEVAAIAKTRFDREESLFEARFRLGGINVKPASGSQEQGVTIDKVGLDVRRPATVEDVQILTAVFHAAKDLRPAVTPIARLEASRQAMQALFDQHDIHPE